MADFVENGTAVSEERVKKKKKPSTNMNIVNVMTCTMNITGESNCIMQLSVGAHPRIST